MLHWSARGSRVFSHMQIELSVFVNFHIGVPELFAMPE
jgi:hypothetical protein